MSTELTRSAGSPKLKRELSRDAIALALNGEWEQAARVNREILESFEQDVDAMNRLGKALMELDQYPEAKEVLENVTRLAPYNTIAKKNLARLGQLERAPAPNKSVRKAARAPQRFIEESGKSGKTVLQKPAAPQVVARTAPSDPVNLVAENDTIKAYTRGDEYLGQIEPKLGRRLIRLMQGGNKYECAIVGVSGQAVSVIIWETLRHRNLQNVCSFPSKSKGDRRAYLNESLAWFTRDEDLDDDDEDEGLIEEDEIESDWDENE